MSRGERNTKEAERIAKVRLAWTPRIGPVTFRHLLSRYETATEAIEALPGLARRGGSKDTPKVPPASEVEAEMERLSKLGGRMLVAGDEDYPSLLAATEDAPPFLETLGQDHLLGKKALAIVGARNASAIGRRLAEKFAREVAGEGYIIISGLARGIDGAAHTGALDTGTIAVLGGALNIYYPRENRMLQDEVAGRGLLVSEHRIGTRPQASHFPRRNRIISALSLGVLVVEAAPRSGSLITARLAGEQGREVMAVPGSPLDPRAQGANNLIRSGASLVETPEDILEILSGLHTKGLSEPPADSHYDMPREQQDKDLLSDARKRVQELLSPTPVPVDDLIRMSKLPAGVVLTVLLEMEIAGSVSRGAGHSVALTGE